MAFSPSGLVVGCGSIGQRHLDNLLSLGVIDVSVVEPDEQRRVAVAGQYDLSSYSTLDEALSSDPDFGIVCTPNSKHVPVAQTLVDAGCHVFIEKPLSHTLVGIDELVSSVSREDVISMVGCNMRFHPAIRRIRELVDGGYLGTLVAVRIAGGSYLPEWHPNRDYRRLYSAREDLGGGVVLDYIHEIDYARWLFGDVDNVSGMAAQRSSLDIETEDVAGIILRFQCGAVGQIHLDYVQRPYSRSCHVIGETGTIRWQWGDGVRWYTAENNEWECDSTNSDWDLNDMYIDELRHFLDCIEEHKRPISDVSDGRESLRVALAVKESSASGKHIPVSEPDGY